jgi:hypothetical protein
VVRWKYDKALKKTIGISVLSQEGKQLVSSHHANIKALDQRQQTELDQLHETIQASTNERQASNISNIYVLISITLAIELLIILLHFFINKYKYMNVHQSELLTAPAPIQINAIQLRQMLNSVLSTNENIQLNTPLNTTASSSSVGFELNAEHGSLVESIENGCRDYRTLSKLHKVSFQAIKKALHEHDTKE